ncbi:hypothetical protein RvY_07606 [Ramazzottius varieornatus]|uniref:Peptidase M14 domain-containing protein n=1 Tax=Ramazzottius varieornatus TaxID=947166 RepID=A0A1D1V8V5_RAMVA|nr:hypothetical protein RvY_07606 [Ramazzottius varieornatus]
MRWQLLVALVAAATWTAARGEVKDDFRGYKVYRLVPRTPQHVDFLNNLQSKLEEQVPVDEVEIWSDIGQLSPEAVGPVLIMVSPEHQAQMTKSFDAEKIPYEVTIADLNKAILEESRRSDVRSTSSGGISWTEYHDYPVILSFVDFLVRDYPSLVTKTVLGQTYEGRDIVLLKIGKPPADGKTKPAFWMDANIHAREWISSATLTYMTNKLVTEYATNQTIQGLVNQLDWYILPVVNPDGFAWTHNETKNRLWRTTRKVNPYSNCLGADPNRNYDHRWMVAGADQKPCSNTFAGPYPYSETENLVLTEAYLARQSQIKAMLSFHSYSQYWLTPFGDKTFPPDIAELKAVAHRAVNALTSQFGTKYKVGSPSEILYDATGGTHDWAKAKGLTKYSYTPELRDTGKHGFVLPPEQIIPSGIETWEAVKVIADQVIAEFGPTLD